jgi:hypothetical protein
VDGQEQVDEHGELVVAHHEEKPKAELFLELRLLDYARDAVIAVLKDSESIDEAIDRLKQGRFSVVESAPQSGTFVLVFMEE